MVVSVITECPRLDSTALLPFSFRCSQTLQPTLLIASRLQLPCRTRAACARKQIEIEIEIESCWQMEYAYSCLIVEHTRSRTSSASED